MRISPFRIGGALTDEDAQVYIQRTADHQSVMHLRAMNYIMLVEPRQQGKTSLINCLVRHPALSDIAFAYVDVSTLGKSTEGDLYYTLCQRLLGQLRVSMPDSGQIPVPRTSTEWRDFLSNVAKSSAKSGRKAVIALDEIGVVAIPNATGFFGVLRDIYNSRQNEIEFRHITFLLSGAFHPRDLIQDDRISPFNVAQRVRLADFSQIQVRDLVSQGRWKSDQSALIAERIHYWTAGQPYLTQLLCFCLDYEASPIDVDGCVERLEREDDNHLPPLVDRLLRDAKLFQYTYQVLDGQRIRFNRADPRHAQLELLGVLKADVEGDCIIRNRIYKRVLRSCAHLPVSPRPPQRTGQGSGIHIGAVRNLLRAAFTEKGMRRFCQERPEFEPVLSEFGSGFSLEDIIDRIVEYCEKRDLFPTLLTEVQEENPKQYNRYATQIGIETTWDRDLRG